MNGGWPYCMGSNSRTDDPNLTSDGPFGFSHNDYNFFTSTQGAWYDCNTPGALVNDSRWNTGLRHPAAGDARDGLLRRPPDRSAAAGVLQRSARPTSTRSSRRWAARATTTTRANPSPTKWPAYWDDKWFFYEFDNRYIAAMDDHGRRQRRRRS